MKRISGRNGAGAFRGVVAINRRPKRSPWGGGNQFVELLTKFWSRWDMEVTYELKPGLTGILLVEPREGDDTTFGIEEIIAYRKEHPQVLCVHRINECDQRKGTHHMDALLREANRVADMTVFISGWLRDYFVARWFDPRRLHVVIYNGADPEVFRPDLKRNWDPTSPLDIVTHHWSANWMKGFRVYQALDRMIASGEISGVRLNVIGRYPKEISWRTARVYGPRRGRRLAGLLRKKHAYLTASLWEPCGMHHVEGAQCGLPVLYHEDGGGIVEAASRYGIGFRDNLKEAIERLKGEYTIYREKVLGSAPSGLVCAKRYLEIFAP